MYIYSETKVKFIYTMNEAFDIFIYTMRLSMQSIYIMRQSMHSLVITLLGESMDGHMYF